MRISLNYTVCMGLSEEDRKRIEEEEFRRSLREKYERELRLSVDVRADTRQQVEVRGVSTEIYRDAKHGASAAGRGVAAGLGKTYTMMLFLLYWFFFVASAVLMMFGIYLLFRDWEIRDVRYGGFILVPLLAVVLGSLIWWRWIKPKPYGH